MTDLRDRLNASLVDRYRIERELGRGGMATVYLAEDLKHHRPVAVKVLKPDLAAVLGAERFLREIDIAANLHHPHILPLYDSGRTGGPADRRVDSATGTSANGQRPTADDFLFYVMPFVEGETLRDRLDREKQLPLDDALQICREVADALSYAHAHGVVHRDIKPENILLESGHAVVADFGIARAIDQAGGERLTGTGVALGTPAYMSPEQAAGSRDLDGRSDLYSLGCVLYEMLAGQPPFTGPTVESLVQQHLTAEPPHVTGIRPAVPGHVAATLERALAKTPADRFNPVALFAEALAPMPATRHVSAPPASRRWSPGRVVLLALIAVVALTGAVLIGRHVAQAPALPATAGDRVVVLPYENRTGDPALDPLGPMVADWVTEGLMQTGAVQVVPHLMVAEAVAQNRDTAGGVLLRRLGDRTQAKIAVMGSYYRRGDTLEFHSEVVDVTAGTPLGPIGAVRGAVGDPRGAIDSVRVQVMGALATRLSPLIGWELPPNVQPPTYEASQAYERGMEEWVRSNMSGAAAWFERAYAIDTTYLRSLEMAAIAHGNAGERARRDSLFAIVSSRREELAPYDRYRLDFVSAPDVESRLAAVRAAVRLVPFGTARTGLVLALVESNRPHEALHELEALLPQIGETAGRWQALWDIHTSILHLLGDHEREIEVAREGRERAAGTLYLLLYEGRALAALGRVAELDTLAGTILATAPQTQLVPGEALAGVADEARAHGHGAAARALVDRALEWYAAQPEPFRTGARGRMLRGRLLYLREDWRDADQAFAALASDSVRIASVLGRRGTLAARLGDGAGARRFAAELAKLQDPDGGGSIPRWRARIAALLGDRDEAVALLQQTLTEGVGFGMWVHTDADLDSLHGYPPFEELMRPKG